MARSTNKRKPARKVEKRNIVNGNVSGIVIQDTGNVTITQNTGLRAGELAAVFEQAYRRIAERPEDANVTKDEIKETVKKIEDEAARGEKANQNNLERWMGYLKDMAPDVVDVILASMGGPVSGFTAVFQKIAKKAAESK
jgi:hypothetical protein